LVGLLTATGLRKVRRIVFGLTVAASRCYKLRENASGFLGGAVAQLGARLDGIEEVVGSNPIGSTNLLRSFQSDSKILNGR
jgi:hypothetical protein